MTYSIGISVRTKTSQVLINRADITVNVTTDFHAIRITFDLVRLLLLDESHKAWYSIVCLGSNETVIRKGTVHKNNNEHEETEL